MATEKMNVHIVGCKFFELPTSNFDLNCQKQYSVRHINKTVKKIAVGAAAKQNKHKKTNNNENGKQLL